MQTFLPFPTTDFSSIAKVLDNKRLNKQALEGWQIVMTLFELDPNGNHRTPKGWVNHPAVRMWKGYETALIQYVLDMTYEWKQRGFKTTIDTKIISTLESALSMGRVNSNSYPSWMLNPALYEKIAASHRTALLVKDYDWYSQFGWSEQNGPAVTEYEYVWPV